MEKGHKKNVARRGRNARMVGRQQAKNDDQQAKWMGVSGGQFEPLTSENIDEIHEAVICVTSAKLVPNGPGFQQ